MKSWGPSDVVFGGILRKRHDPLWRIVDEKIPLQGAEDALKVRCPYCHVAVQLPRGMVTGRRFECGLCGSRCELVDDGQGGRFEARLLEEDRARAD